MSLRVLVAVSHLWEGDLVERVGDAPSLEVVRRCADLADLLAAAAAGVGEVGLLSADVRALDRAALEHLATHEVRVVGVVRAGDEDDERTLRRLGVTAVLTLDDVIDLPERLGRGEGGLGPLLAADPAGDEDVDRLLGDLRDGSPVPATPVGTREPTAIPASRDPLSPNGSSDPGSRPSSVVVAVWGPTGAPGRSTVALNLAAESAGLGHPTLLVDLDTWGSSQAQALSLLDEAPGIAAAARASEQGTLDLPGLARLAPVVGPDLRILTGLPRADRWPEVREGAVEHVLGLARRLARVVVLDCGFSLEDDEVLSYDTHAPRRNAVTLTALAHADRLLVVGAGDPVGLQRLVRAVQEVGSMPSPVPEVVVNRVRASAVGPRPERRIREALSRFAGLEQPSFVPLDLEGLDTAVLAGRTLREAAPGSPARAAIAALAATLVPDAAPPATRRERLRSRPV